MRLLTAVGPTLLVAIAFAAPARAGVGLAGLRVVSADATGVTLEYRLPEYRLETIPTPAGEMTRVLVPGLSSTSEEGKPELPAGGAWVAVPPVGGVAARVLEEETETVSAVEIVPVPRSVFLPDGGAGRDAGGWPGEGAGLRPAREFFRDEGAYASEAVYPGPPASVESPSWLRFQRVAALRLFPVRYLAGSRTLLVTRRMVVRVSFAGAGILGPAGMRGAGLEPGPADDGRFEAIYRSTVVNHEQGRAWRARPLVRAAPVGAGATTPGSAVPAPALDLGTGNPEWKVRVDSTGVWRVTFDQLRAKGWPDPATTTVGVGAVTAFRRDTTVALEPAPWAAVEIPIDVIDRNDNGTFDSGDFVVLPVRNWAERVAPTWYERRYGDAEVVWISYKSAGAGLRVRPAPGWLGALNPTRPTSFPSLRRYERNFDYFPYPTDVTTIDQFCWTNGAESAPIDTIYADLLDLDPGGGSVQVQMQWVGKTDERHHLTVDWLNGLGQATPLLQDVVFSNRQVFTTAREFSVAQATAGPNRLRLDGYRETSAPPVPGTGAGFNWFEVTYPRLYRARNNRLEFTSGAAADTVEFVVEGFRGASAPPLYAYDVTDFGDPARLVLTPSQVEAAGGEWRLRLQAYVPAGAPRRYVAAADVSALPDAAITADVPSSLYLTPPGGADFVIVVHDGFADAVQPLADFRRQQGIPTLVARGQDVYDEFGGGRKSHFALRRFLGYALARWDTRFVLLVGDASEDAQGWLGSSAVDYVPTPVIHGPVPVSFTRWSGTEVVPSDNWYVFGLTGGESPGTDLLADMVIARWSVGDNEDGTRGVEQTQGLVAKSIAYETERLAEPWRNRAVLIADDDYSTESFFGGGGTFCYCRKPSEGIFQTINEVVRTSIRETAGYRDFDLRPFYLKEMLPAFPAVSCGGCSTARDFLTVLDHVSYYTSPALLTLLGEGAAFVNFQGHGNAKQMTHEELYVALGPVQDIDVIANDGKPWVFSGFACHLNAYALASERRAANNVSYGDGIGERMVNAPGKGAIASFASVGYELLPFTAGNHLDVHFHNAFFLDPPAGEFAGQSGARVRVGEATLTGVYRMVASTFGLERLAARTYVLLGDPLAAMNFGPPRFFASAVDRDSIASGQPYYPSVDADVVRVDVRVLDESALAYVRVREEGEGALGAVPDSELVFTPTFPDAAGNRYTVTRQLVPRPASYEVRYSAADRSGLESQFVLSLVLEASLTQSGRTIRNGDAARPVEPLAWKVRSPARLGAADFRALLDGAEVPVTATRDPADTTGRTWTVGFAADLSLGSHRSDLEVAPARGGVTRSVQFRVLSGLDVERVYAFPNPFRTGTRFSFEVASGEPADVVLRVFTVGGTPVYERAERGLAPGYYQWPWDGRDLSGNLVAHGVYIFRVASSQGGGRNTHMQGKVVRAPISGRDANP